MPRKKRTEYDFDPCGWLDYHSLFNLHQFPKIQDRFDTSGSKIEKIGDEFNFLSRKCELEKEGPWTQAGNYIQQMLKAYEEQIGKIKLQQLPSDNSTQMEDKSEVLHELEKISPFRSIALDQVST